MYQKVDCLKRAQRPFQINVFGLIHSRSIKFRDRCPGHIEDISLAFDIYPLAAFCHGNERYPRPLLKYPVGHHAIDRQG